MNPLHDPEFGAWFIFCLFGLVIVFGTFAVTVAALTNNL